MEESKWTMGSRKREKTYFQGSETGVSAIQGLDLSEGGVGEGGGEIRTGHESNPRIQTGDDVARRGGCSGELQSGGYPGDREERGATLEEDGHWWSPEGFKKTRRRWRRNGRKDPCLRTQVWAPAQGAHFK